MPTRRNVLRILGGGTIVAAAAAAGFAATRTPAAALAPWTEARAYTDRRKRALAHAILAPNPHNRQPWLVELVGEDGVRLHRDDTRTLPETDPFHRQIYIGLGCFLELLVIAASQNGDAVAVTLFPEGEDGPVADINWTDTAPADPLAQHILARRSCKEPYADRPVPADAVAALSPHAAIITDPARVAAIRDIAWDALQIEMLTPHTLKESIDLIRVGKAEINANPDGIEIRGALFDALRKVGYLTNDVLLDTEHFGFQGEIDRQRSVMMATPAWAVVTTAGNDRAAQIDAGRRWLRLNLTTTQLGLSLHPTSQALQEYPEVAAPNAAIHAELAAPGETVQMLGRLGYGPASDPTPRWSLDTRIVHG